jgi:SET domain-containing protein
LSAAKIVLPEPGLLELVPIKGKGRGVVTTRAIKKGKLIEAGPVIRMKKVDRLDRSTVLSHYPFEWNDKPYVQAFPLGYAGLLNHSDTPNCKIETDIPGGTLCIFSLRNIEPGEELTWSYGIDPWFEVTK